LSLNAKSTIKISKISLFNQGFFTAIANPKGWAFMIALLPPFINKNQALPLQLSVLVFIIMLSEFICMLIYAKGGSTIGRLIKNQKNVALMNKVSGSLMIGVSFWLALS
jgi:threonine/homoserine/homoserine lactone efflux protein